METSFALAESDFCDLLSSLVSLRPRRPVPEAPYWESTWRGINLILDRSHTQLLQAQSTELPLSYNVLRRRKELVERASREIYERGVALHTLEIRKDLNVRLRDACSRAFGTEFSHRELEPGELDPVAQRIDFEREARELHVKDSRELKHVLENIVIHKALPQDDLNHSKYSESLGWHCMLSSLKQRELQGKLDDCSEELGLVGGMLVKEKQLKRKLHRVVSQLHKKLQERSEDRWLANGLEGFAKDSSAASLYSSSDFNQPSDCFRKARQSFFEDNLHILATMEPSLRGLPLDLRYESQRIREEVARLRLQIRNPDLEIESLHEKFDNAFEDLIAVLELKAGKEILEQALEEQTRQLEDYLKALFRLFAWLHELIFRIVHSHGYFFEWPHRRRPPCTTMP
jgi:hypothetical protein